MGNAGGAEAGKESGNVTGVRNGEGAGRAVVMQRETEEFSSDGVGFGMVKGGEARDEKGKVRGMVVFDAEVVHHQDKGDGARGVAEEAGGLGLVKVEGLEEGDKTKVGKFTCLFEAVHSFVYAESDVVLACLVLFGEG